MRYLKIFIFCSLVLLFACNNTKSKNRLMNKNTQETSGQKEDILFQKDSDNIKYPPVPDGCVKRGRWHVTNKNDSILNVYILIFDCEGTYYVTRNGITVKLYKEGNRLFESFGDTIVDDYYEIKNGTLRLGQKGLGDYTDNFGYIIKSY